MRVTLGVSGGIAAYKAVELVRELQQLGLEVQAVLTDSAQEFVRPLTFAALTGRKVITSMFGSGSEEANLESAIEHIGVAQATDLLLIAPATADCLAKLANGVADDFLTTMYLATVSPVIVAPAMNVNMWSHPATRENVERLRARGVGIVEPEAGYLACGMTGPGRLASNDAVLAAVRERLGLREDLKGEVVVVTAGPTREAIDPIRYITNRSSGKMGYAIAAAAQRRGARTLLVSGPSAEKPPENVELVPVTTVSQMRDAVLARWDEATVLIKAAAPADYRPQAAAAQKIRKSGDSLTLVLEPTEDILRELGERKGGRILVGFAAETEDLEMRASEKLSKKHLDLIVGNDVSGEETPFDSDFNRVTILGAGGYLRSLDRMPKAEVASEILNEVVRLRGNGRPKGNH